MADGLADFEMTLSGEVTNPAAMAAAMLGVGYSDHFLTLPDRRTLTIPEGKDAWDVYTPYAIEAISKGYCPWCASVLSERRECRNEIHPACRWHVCETGWGQRMLDARGEPGTCVECGQPL
jgi:hypothetical protein